MNRNALLEISQNPLASQAQRDAAFRELHILDNPTRVVGVDLLAQPTEVAKPNHVSPERVALIFTGQEWFKDPAGWAEADARILASGRCPEWNGDEQRELDRQNSRVIVAPPAKPPVPVAVAVLPEASPELVQLGAEAVRDKDMRRQEATMLPAVDLRRQREADLQSANDFAVSRPDVRTLQFSGPPPADVGDWAPRY
jgi:hypothetical protein